MPTASLEETFSKQIIDAAKTCGCAPEDIRALLSAPNGAAAAEEALRRARLTAEDAQRPFLGGQSPEERRRAKAEAMCIVAAKIAANLRNEEAAGLESPSPFFKSSEVV